MALKAKKRFLFSPLPEEVPVLYSKPRLLGHFQDANTVNLEGSGSQPGQLCPPGDTWQWLETFLIGITGSGLLLASSG